MAVIALVLLGVIFSALYLLWLILEDIFDILASEDLDDDRWNW